MLDREFLDMTIGQLMDESRRRICENDVEYLRCEKELAEAKERYLELGLEAAARLHIFRATVCLPCLCPKGIRYPSMAIYLFSATSGFFSSALGIDSFRTPLSYLAWISSCFMSLPT